MSGIRSALIVATSEYDDPSLTKLDGPGQDADALRAVLAAQEIGEFDVRLALNSPVDALRRTIEAFFADRARDDLLLVHFSGHGLKDDDGQLYLAASDTELNRLASTGVDAGWVNRLMNKCRSEKIALFLDCCFAGAFTAGLARRAAGDTAGVKEQFTGSGLFVITASDAMQYSFEGGRQIGQPPEPSPFTKALVDGLRTGEADRNEDGVVSINELFDYLEDRVRETSPSQTPTKSAFNQVGDWAIAKSTRVPSVRLLAEELQAHLKSENPLDRFTALIELRDIIEGPDERLAEAATQAVQKLTGDDSNRVAAAAKQILADNQARPRPASPPEPTVTVPEPPVSPMSPITTPATPPPATAVGQGTALAADTAGVLPESPPIPEPRPTVAAPPANVATPATVVIPSAPATVVPSPQATAPAVVPSSQATAPAVATPRPTEAVPASTAWGAVAPSISSSPGPAPEKAARRGSAAAPWSMARAAARAAIGAFIGTIIQFVWVITANSGVLEDPVAMEFLASKFGEILLDLMVLGAVVVVVVERFVPAVRLPFGELYRIVGNNRWLAAAVLGTVFALTLGWGSESMVFGADFGAHRGLGVAELVVSLVIGFVVAEAAIGKRFGGQRAQRTATA